MTEEQKSFMQDQIDKMTPLTKEAAAGIELDEDHALRLVLDFMPNAADIEVWRIIDGQLWVKQSSRHPDSGHSHAPIKVEDRSLEEVLDHWVEQDLSFRKAHGRAYAHFEVVGIEE